MRVTLWQERAGDPEEEFAVREEAGAYLAALDDEESEVLAAVVLSGATMAEAARVVGRSESKARLIFASALQNARSMSTEINKYDPRPTKRHRRRWVYDGNGWLFTGYRTVAVEVRAYGECYLDFMCGGKHYRPCTGKNLYRALIYADAIANADERDIAKSAWVLG